jgi:asparaginyl-tRNA synthetase
LGDCNDDYPLSKSKMSLDYLRNYAHLRARTSTFGSVFRIKSGINLATYKFFEKENYIQLDPNILTINECEGGAGVFQVTENDISFPFNLPLIKETSNFNNEQNNTKKEIITNKYDWSKDHFNKPVYLTVSSQL